MQQRFHFYYGWINVVVAAWTMVATLPGRTHGLGLITKPLLADLELSESAFAQINLWSCLLGALFALPMGWLIDRVGVRLAGTAVVGLLSASVFQLPKVDDGNELFLCLTLIRGFGQSALSVVSIAMISKWFRRGLAPAMGVYAVLLTFGFVFSVLGMGWAIDRYGWRQAWQLLGYGLLFLTPAVWLLVRSTPEELGVAPDPEPKQTHRRSKSDPGLADFTLLQALLTPAFWIIALATSAFNLVWSSITLFNEPILNELGFDQKAAVEMMAYLTGLGLISNLIAGKLATRKRIGILLGVALLALSFALVWFPSIRSPIQLRLYGAVMGFVGGIVTVVHFSVWGQFFGRAEIGRIQGVAQVLTVLASAIGPTCVAWFADQHHSHLPAYYGFALLTFFASMLSFLMPLPILSTQSPSTLR
ncbi:MAG: MFS transporter [Planctomycetota bacterium]|nr:MFS transporter [Planctomycetota bacterium]